MHGVDIGRLHYFLGVKVIQNKNNIWIGQTNYIKILLTKFGIRGYHKRLPF